MGMSWAAAGCVLALLGRAALGGSAVTVVVAAFSAAVRGGRWHREDVESGSRKIAA